MNTTKLVWKKVLKWVGIVLVLFIILCIWRFPIAVRNGKTAEQVAKIHNTKLQLADVMGDNLPPDPGAEADKTVAGVDANQNGIRDDVELAVFKVYPDSAKTRAVLLQYALALQMEFTQPIINTVTATEVIREEDRADSCISDTLVPRKNPESSRSDADMQKIDSYISSIKKLQINTNERNQAQEKFYDYLRSYSSLDAICDIDYSTLPN